MKTQIEQEPVACIYNGNQYMRHEFMDDKIPEGATPLYAAPVDTIRLETEYLAATLRINNDLRTIEALTAERDALELRIGAMIVERSDAFFKVIQERDAYAAAADTMAAAHKVERDALKEAARLALDALYTYEPCIKKFGLLFGTGNKAIAALKAVL